MMQIMRHILYLSLVTILFIACNETPDELSGIEKVSTLTVRVNVPGMNIVPTYALDAIDECEIECMDVLVFNAKDSTLLYVVEGENIQMPDLAKPNEQTFDIQIEQTPKVDKVFLMFIANARQVITDAKANDVIVAGKKRKVIMEKLVFSAQGKWLVKPGRFTRFPMWGESEEIDISGAIHINTITLMRSIAKIDVAINYNENTNVFDGLGTNFKLEVIYLYHSYDRLQICPNPDYVTENRNGVLAASVPESAGTNVPLEYLVNGHNDNVNKIAFTNSIYTAEHEKENVCLVIGGYYSTSGSVGTTLSYYRVDFLQSFSGTDGELSKQILLPLLRNHLYRINITAVYGPGAATKEDALASTASNLVVQLTDSDLSDTEYNQHYKLSVNTSLLTFNKEQQEQREIAVSATYSKGWTATTANSWIMLEQTSGAISDHKLTFGLLENKTGDSRTGKIIFTAGTLTKEVTIVQAAIADLEISGVENSYVMNLDNAYSFTVKSLYDWQVKISDPSMMLCTFTTSGTSTTSGSSFKFTLMNNTEEATATLTFYSLTGEFAPVDVEIHGISQ